MRASRRSRARFKRRLSIHVAGRICGSGALPYLHAYADNRSAIGLYESIGFLLRETMYVAAVRRDIEAFEGASVTQRRRRPPTGRATRTAATAARAGPAATIR
jgi:ribosomal protein S18 acetylase RimI-like enzyme